MERAAAEVSVGALERAAAEVSVGALGGFGTRRRFTQVEACCVGAGLGAGTGADVFQTVCRSGVRPEDVSEDLGLFATPTARVGGIKTTRMRLS